MKRLRKLIVCGLALACAATVFAGKPIDLRLKDGSRWRGEVSDRVVLTFVQQGVEIELTGRIVDAAELYLTVEGDIAGELRRKTIFRDDIRTIRTVHADEQRPAARARPARSRRGGAEEPASGAQPPGVFVLPMRGEVGRSFRHEQIEKIAEHADQYGQGQIIVLLMDSHGGGIEMETIHETIMGIKKRHRVVAWIKTAISAAAASALACDEIYFMTEGTLGAMTGYSGATSFKGKELRAWMEAAGKWMEAGERSKYIAHAMIHAPSMVSYTKDPETGEITWYDDLSGQVVLSDAKSNLVLTSGSALRCGFSDGTADTGEELAKLLDLPEWRETNDYGRKIAQEWYDTVKRADREIPKLRARLSYAGTGSGDPVEILGKQIQILQEILRWYDRLDPLQLGRPREDIEREVKELRKQIADLRKRQRR